MKCWRTIHQATEYAHSCLRLLTSNNSVGLNVDPDLTRTNNQERMRLYVAALGATSAAGGAYQELSVLIERPKTKANQKQYDRAVDDYVANMRRYRTAVATYKDSLLRAGDYAGHTDKSFQVAFSPAEWKGKLEYRLPEQPPPPKRLVREQKQYDAEYRVSQASIFSLSSSDRSPADRPTAARDGDFKLSKGEPLFPSGGKMRSLDDGGSTLALHAGHKPKWRSSAVTVTYELNSPSSLSWV